MKTCPVYDNLIESLDLFKALHNNKPVIKTKILEFLSTNCQDYKLEVKSEKK
jgi:hypothetical protein